MKTTDDMDTCVQCAKICYVLATVPETSVIASLIDGGIMAGLSAMCATLTDAQAKEESMIALCNVSGCTDRHKELIDQGLVQVGRHRWS